MHSTLCGRKRDKCMRGTVSYHAGYSAHKVCPCIADIKDANVRKFFR